MLRKESRASTNSLLLLPPKDGASFPSRWVWAGLRDSASNKYNMEREWSSDHPEDPRFTSPVIRHSDTMHPISRDEESTSMAFLLKIHNLSLIRRKHQTRPNRVLLHNKQTLSSEVSRSWKTAWRRLRGMRTKRNGRSWNRKRTLEETPGKSE